MNLSAGKLENNGTLTSGSMSAEIERALSDLVPLGPNEDPMGRRKLCLAIARGTLKHFKDRFGAVQVSVQLSGGTTQLISAQFNVDLGGWS